MYVAFGILPSDPCLPPTDLEFPRASALNQMPMSSLSSRSRTLQLILAVVRCGFSNRYHLNSDSLCRLIRFNGVVKLKSFVMVGGGGGSTPQTLKMCVPQHKLAFSPSAMLTTGLFAIFLGSPIETTSTSRMWRA